jgi:two-component sensor histidine kinase
MVKDTTIQTTEDELDFSKRKKLTIQYLNIAIAAFIISFLPDLYYAIWDNVLVAAVGIVIIMAIKQIVRVNYLYLGMALLSILINVVVFYYSGKHGRESFTQFFFIPIMMASPFIFTMKKTGLVILNISFSLLLWISLELFGYDKLQDPSIGNELIRIYEYFNMVIVVGVLMFFTFLVLRNQHHYQQKSQEVKMLLRQSLDQKNDLLKEMHHRVKNNLQLINSLLIIKESTTTNKELQQFIKETADRITSMAVVHDNLLRVGNDEELESDIYLKEISENLIFAYSKTPKQYPIEAKLEKHLLHMEKVLMLGLILNEAISNTMKYAYPGKEGGPIYVEFSELEPRRFLFSVADQGKGYSQHDEETNSSYGLNLIKTFARQIHGDLEIDTSNGVRYSLTFSD